MIDKLQTRVAKFCNTLEHNLLSSIITGTCISYYFNRSIMYSCVYIPTTNLSAGLVN